MTQQSLEVIFYGILIILERHYSDQLPGGKYWNVSPNVKNISSNVPTTNRASESDFAMLDLLVRTKPNAKIQTIQTFILWSRKETSSCLDKKTIDKKDQLFEKARKMVPTMREKYRERQSQLVSLKEKRLIAKQEEKKEMEEKAAAKKLSVVNNLIQTGHKVWLDEKESEENIADIESEKDRCEILEMQIQFYKNVLNVKCANSLFYKTKSG